MAQATSDPRFHSTLHDRLCPTYAAPACARRTFMKACSSLALLASVSACVHIPGRSATIDCVCPRGRLLGVQITLTAPTGQWKFSMHAGGVYREIDLVTIHLPDELAPGAVRYRHSEVRVFVGDIGKLQEVTTLGGTVSIDEKHQRVTVALDVADGSFWANGVYPANAH